MTAQVQKWGNSLALRIPKPFVQQMKVAHGGFVELEMQGEILIARPLKRALSLEEIVDSMDENDPHSETDWGGDVGCEQLA